MTEQPTEQGEQVLEPVPACSIPGASISGKRADSGNRVHSYIYIVQINNKYKYIDICNT
jgi:hypothetical protein